MTGSDDFLSRWSRRKQEVAREQQTDSVLGKKAGAEETGVSGTDERKGKEKTVGAPTGKDAGEPAFDLKSLPSLESITTGSDIRPFLVAGVPAALRQAALRRFWASDPHVRGIVELAENTWDFTGASEIPGFDFSSPSGDLRRMVADLLGEKPAPDEPQGGVDPQPGQSASSGVEGHRNVIHTEKANSKELLDGATRMSPPPDAVGFQSADENVRTDDATQQNDATQNRIMKISRRLHGGAMPK